MPVSAKRFLDALLKELKLMLLSIEEIRRLEKRAEERKKMTGEQRRGGGEKND